jgi:peptide/nickel transport system permease protein
VRPPFATWGNILADGRNYIFDAPWLFVIPGTAILVVVLAFNLVGEGLRDAMNPRLRKRAN